MKTFHPTLVALTASLGLFLVILDNTIVNVAVVPISRALNADVHAVQWVISAYFLAQASVIPVAGYFGVRFGIKRVFLIAFGLFIVSSGLCGLARTEVELIFFRVFQGLGGGALYPMAQSIAFGAFAAKDRAKAVSLTMIPAVLAPTLGPLSGGWLTLHFGWASIFLVNVPLGLFFLFLASRILPRDTPHSRERKGSFDYLGLGLCVAGVLAVTYAFSLVGDRRPGSVDVLHPQGLPYGWFAPITLGCLFSGIAILTVFAFYELKRKDPVLNLRLFLRREFAVASAISWINNGIFFGSMLVLPFFLIHIRSPQLSPLDVGWLLMPQGIGSALIVVFGSWLRRRLGVTVMIMAGAFLLGVSSWGIAGVSAEADVMALLPWIFLRGMGFGTVFQLTQSTVVEGLQAQELPKATSLFNVTRQISSSIGLAAMLSFFGQCSAHQAVQIQKGSGASLSAEQVLQIAGLTAFHDLFQLLGLAALGMVFLVFLLPKKVEARAPVQNLPLAAAEPEASS